MNNQMPRLGMNGHGQFGYGRQQQQFQQQKKPSKKISFLLILLKSLYNSIWIFVCSIDVTNPAYMTNENKNK